ncbi:MAG: saccharopine dehydrogenase NADP-binding domain-containing protein, partial [Pseudobdellovibrio sp.]
MSKTTGYTVPNKNYGEIKGPIVMIGFGSIGRGTLPLIERHFKFQKDLMVVIDPSNRDEALLKKHGIKFLHTGLTDKNYVEILTPLLKSNLGPGFCVNLSVDVSSVDVMKLCRSLGAFYIDTVVEPWAGFYFDNSKGAAARSNYALREALLEEKRNKEGGITAVSCCGANPGMVSWFVKQALVNLANELKISYETPKKREDWAQLMQKVGVKGIHIAERDTQ